MRYEGDIYRPPSEAYSLLVQVTIGCTHNKCTFCKMFKDKKFRVRNLDEVFEDLAWARRRYSRVERMFLCDGDALALSNKRLMPILKYISDNFPECERVTIYGRATDVLKKTDEEMRELYEAGLTMVYIGAESGSDKVLKDICKGETRQELIDAVRKIEACGMKSSVTFISGLAGKDGWEDHAIQTGTMISEMEPSQVSPCRLFHPSCHSVNCNRPSPYSCRTALCICCPGLQKRRFPECSSFPFPVRSECRF